MADDKIRQESENFRYGLIAFKLAQLVWQNGGGKGDKPEIGHYIPHLAKSPEQEGREMMEMCKMFNAAMGGADFEGGECADPDDLKNLQERRKSKALQQPAGRGFGKGRPKPAAEKA